MGKKSKESSVDPSVGINSLFSVDNPFRRELQPGAAAASPGVIPSTQTKLGFSEDNTLGEKDEAVRKRKSDGGVKSTESSPPSEGVEPIPRKLKRLVREGDGEEPKMKKKKRKRDEVEFEYEKRKQVLREDGVAAATLVAVGGKRKAPDSAAEMLDTNDVFDDESKLLRTVFVGNLPLKTKRKALNREFARFGEIESVRLRSVPLVDTNAPRKAAVIMGQINKNIDSVNAYIVFKEEQSAQSALSHNMALVEGNHIRVDMACPPRKKMKGESRVYDRKKTAFVGNLPFDVKDEELYQLFCGLSPSEPNIEAVRVIRDPSTSAGKGVAYVLFKTRDAANQVCRRRDLKIRDRNLRICHVKSDTAPSNKVKEAPPRSLSFPSQNLASTHFGRGEKRKREAAALSYEGRRSSKKGAVNKAFPRRFSSGRSDGGSSRSSWNEPKARLKKRPAVASRKEKQLNKRKQAGGTPENTHRNKKARKL